MECLYGYPKTMESGEPAVMHCLKSIYGLNQISRLLHQRFSKFLRASGFKHLVSDHCVKTKGTGNDQVIVCWVDDGILASSRDNHAARSWFDTSLCTEFEVSTWTPGVEASWIQNLREIGSKARAPPASAKSQRKVSGTVQADRGYRPRAACTDGPAFKTGGDRGGQS